MLLLLPRPVAPDDESCLLLPARTPFRPSAVRPSSVRPAARVCSNRAVLAQPAATACCLTAHTVARLADVMAKRRLPHHWQAWLIISYHIEQIGSLPTAQLGLAESGGGQLKGGAQAR